MAGRLPSDPIMCLSVVNTKLRDFYSDLDELCEEFDISRSEIEEKLKMVGYKYDKEKNQFIAV